jgi:arginine N-succinyltransferase
MRDLDALCELATRTGFGLTTLPRDAELLGERIQESLASFDRMSRRPRGETYLFVMEDQDAGKIVGTCGIVSKVGGFEPFYAYKMESERFRSEMLNVDKQVQTLHLVLDHNGPCEIGSLFLSPEYRRGGNGRLLSLSRFVFMALHRQRFDPMVIAEMRGVIDDRGQSAFWDAVGKHFFEIDFPKADYLSMVNKKFIADLMPKHPIYTALLPAAAQAVIGAVHDDTKPALAMLREEGFALSGMVDIFEAGPVVQCARDAIRTVRQCTVAEVAEIVDGKDATARHVIAAAGKMFAACAGEVTAAGSGAVRISGAVARALGVGVGDKIAYAALRAADGNKAQEKAGSDVGRDTVYRQPVD